MKKRFAKPLLGVAVAFIILVLTGFAFVAWRLYESGKGVYTLRSAQVSELMRENPQFFDEVFTKILPEALECQGNVECVVGIRSRLDLLTEATASESSTIDVPGYFSDVSLANNQPMYFITLDQDRIVKLFFSGGVITSPVETRKEALRDVLLGKRDKLYGLQANVDGLRMTYLNDLYSEAEIIVPYVKDGKIIGAVVYLHGD
ncbi:hypothetical protein KKE34_05730 [Patescibacteria group bacterium]|nr:hypothetical protein [Patescibacteria group bacterium]MBU1886071.1 hypothetical protein [Patescibacteria group bacterium]